MKPFSKWVLEAISPLCSICRMDYPCNNIAMRNRRSTNLQELFPEPKCWAYFFCGFNFTATRVQDACMKVLSNWQSYQPPFLKNFMYDIGPTSFSKPICLQWLGLFGRTWILKQVSGFMCVKRTDVWLMVSFWKPGLFSVCPTSSKPLAVELFQAHSLKASTVHICVCQQVDCLSWVWQLQGWCDQWWLSQSLSSCASLKTPLHLCSQPLGFV